MMKRMSRIGFGSVVLLAATVLIACGAEAQDAGLDTMPRKDIRPNEVVIWNTHGGTLSKDGRVAVRLSLETRDRFAIYQERLEFSGPDGMRPERVEAPKTEKIPDPMGKGDVEVFAGGDFTVVLSSLSPWTARQFPLSIRYTACARGICLFPYTETLTVDLVDGEIASAPQAPAPAPSGQVASEGASGEEDLQTRWAGQLGGGASFWVILMIVFAAGVATNLTPCVYPMIPITIRLLSRAGSSPWIAGSAYAGGILVTYTGLGLVASLGGQMFGSMLANVWFNLFFAVVMALLGFTMMGFGDFSKLQMLGGRVSAGSAGNAKTFLMGVGAGFVASPCTGPVLAALLAYTATGQNVAGGVVLLFTYSFGFALPYVFLGRLAARLSQIRAGERTQLIVKMVFSSVMFALAFYYMRIPAYGLVQVMKPFWGTLSAIGCGVGGLLLVSWLSREAWRANKYLALLPAWVLGFGIFALAQWVTAPAVHDVADLAEYTLLHDETEALAQAKAAGKPLLIDAWAEWCEACKKMDATTFRDPAVRQELAARWVVLKLDLTEETDANAALIEKYSLQSLPVLTLQSSDASRREPISGYVPAATLLAKLKAFQ
jgi:thiol:disulfide interchange protein DsbD